MEPETPRVGQKKDLRKAKQFSMRKAALSTGSKNAAPQAPDLSTSQNHSGIGDEMELDAYDDPSRPMAYSVQVKQVAPAGYDGLRMQAQDEDELLANADRAKTELIEKARQIESLDYEIYENAV